MGLEEEKRFKARTTGDNVTVCVLNNCVLGKTTTTTCAFCCVACGADGAESVCWFSWEREAQEQRALSVD
eukprot:CAMPEP_0174361900 /NCGR_PEP_ID=MMETSP0811_2-20130205/61567_1 /TAXON_ID=73025 ORGANISM="Eutreptiella gymnastica-like, Strain CCMP1594" /NCGR_SAMPLE_ID=MMETSP0811_2 /ASSEMBLY_ACC=CAM_ASM_000667 /LENGTH=69 /DNA_ID=CAMNT_0015498999 /DNA_START=92 /DNA_END=298 /DNA_ORIENTATION=-